MKRSLLATTARISPLTRSTIRSASTKCSDSSGKSQSSPEAVVGVIAESRPPETGLEDPAAQQERKKSVADLDEELRLKMAGLAGDGGEAGIELEDGKPVAMKRAVRDNMFRLI